MAFPTGTAQCLLFQVPLSSGVRFGRLGAGRRLRICILSRPAKDRPSNQNQHMVNKRDNPLQGLPGYNYKPG